MTMNREEVFKFGFYLGKKAASNVLITPKDKKDCHCPDECDKCRTNAAKRLYYLYYITDDVVQNFVYMIGTSGKLKRALLWRRYRKGVTFGIEMGVMKRKAKVMNGGKYV